MRNLITVDLGEWSSGYPTGVVVRCDDESIKSEYCDNADEFIEFIESVKNDIDWEFAHMRFVIDSDDIDRTKAVVKKIRDYFDKMKGELI